METIIGLGSAGCKIADEFKKYPQYSVYKIDVGLKGENCFDFPKQSSPELYEKNCPNLRAFFNTVSDDVLFIFGGGGQISGASLKILEQIKQFNINVLYIKPDNKDLNNVSYLQNRLTFNVLQQYARSGMLNTFYIVDNKILEEIIGDIPILEYESTLNKYIVSLIHYINVFNNTNPVVDNHESKKISSRIATFGVYDFSQETSLFQIKNITDKCYYFAINEDALKTDGKLLKKIKEHISSNEIRASYEIHSTKHPKSFCYFIEYTNVIQEVDN